jgi:photosystem II stability/assembly factor-like uncharacterized protein
VSKKLFAVLAALCAAGFAEAGSWYRFPIWGADVTALAPDRFEAGVIYCGTSHGNIYVSRDGGQSWAPTRPGNEFPGYVVAALRTDARRPGRLWAALAGTDRGSLIARSDDGGEEWTTLARWGRPVNARAFVQSSVEPELLACGGDDGVFLSRDEGRTWLASGQGTEGLVNVQSLAFDPTNPALLYAGTFRQAFRTKDGGGHWARVAEGMVLDATVYSFDFERADPSRLWVSTCGWVYRSENGGDRWTRYTAGFTNRRAPVVRIDPNLPNVLYAGTVGGLHVSEDAGHTWKRVSRETLDISVLEVDDRTGRLWVGSQGEGMFFSDDRGTTLTPGSRGLAEARVPALAADPSNPGRVLFLRTYAGAESGVWESDGDHSALVSSDAPPGTFALAASRIGRQTVWLCASASLVRVSLDGGGHFGPPAQPPRGRILKVLGAPLDAPFVVTDEGVFTTADGSSFTPVSGLQGRPEEAELVTGADGSPVLEVSTSSGDFRLEGDRLVRSGRRRLAGGRFLQGATEAASPYFRFAAGSGTLTVWRGNSVGRIGLPRAELAIADAVIAGDGSLYLATMGDGLFVYRSERAAAVGTASSQAAAGAGR